MIKLKDKINLVTLTDQGLYDVTIKVQDFIIQDGFRLIAPIDNEEYNSVLVSIAAKEQEIINTSITAIATRERKMAERNALYLLRDSLMIKDEGVCTCSLRYFAANEDIEIPLPIQGVTESFSCFVSELDEFSSTYDDIFLNKKYQMKQRVVKFLADTGFAGLNSESDFIVL